MALEQLVNGMTGQQLANTIKNNFDKVLDVESAENKAENAGKALKTDYDATRYVEMELADGTPIRMRWDVFCQAIASVVAEQFKTYFAGGEDLNDIVNSGVYLSGGKNVQNIPVQVTYFFVAVCAYNNGNVFQMFIHNNGSVYIRSKYSTTWYEWIQIR